MKAKKISVPLVLNKRIGLVQKVLLLAHDSSSGVARCVQRHGDVLRAGLVLASNIRKLEELAKDAEGRLQVDPKHSVIMAVVAARTAFAAAVGKLKEETAKFCPTIPAEAADEAAGGTDGIGMEEELKMAVIELWNRQSAQGFEDLIYSEVVMDSVSRVCMVVLDNLEKASTSAEVPFKNVIFQNTWKAEIPCHEGQDPPTFQAVLDCASSKLKGQITNKTNLKGPLEKLSEEWVGFGSYCSFSSQQSIYLLIFGSVCVLFVCGCL